MRVEKGQHDQEDDIGQQHRHQGDHIGPVGLRGDRARIAQSALQHVEEAALPVVDEGAELDLAIGRQEQHRASDHAPPVPFVALVEIPEGTEGCRAEQDVPVFPDARSIEEIGVLGDTVGGNGRHLGNGRLFGCWRRCRRVRCLWAAFGGRQGVGIRRDWCFGHGHLVGRTDCRGQEAIDTDHATHGFSGQLKDKRGQQHPQDGRGEEDFRIGEEGAEHRETPGCRKGGVI